MRNGNTIGAGAANNVMPRMVIRRKAKIRQSRSSIAEIQLFAANNLRVPNEGEIDYKFVTQESHKESMIFQVADVNMGLGSVLC